MSVDSEGACTELHSLSKGGVRAENLRLRRLLANAEEVASRYAVMLREGDHRIKNSLQIVSSLMTLQARAEESPSAREALNLAAARIQSIARMHDALQAGEGSDLLDLGSVIEKMCEGLAAMGGNILGVAVRVTADHVKTPLAFAQPIVLAVNELVVNALRHAFPDGRTGAIDVRLINAGGELHVVVSDDGVGLPAGHSEALAEGRAEGRGYGMKLVRTMVSQVKGVLSVESGAGTRVTIVIPAAQPVAAAPPRGFATAPNRPPTLRLLRKPWGAGGRG
jgi:two-component system, sensor histidine kinase PdtaS